MSYEADIKKLEDALRLEQPLMGCHRRNVWDGGDPAPYSLVKGNAILLALGAQRIKFITPVGPSEHLRLGDRLITFRAGYWQDYWKEDIAIEIAIAHQYSGLKGLSTTGLIAWENKGRLQIIEVKTKEFKIDVISLVSSFLSAGRISKSGQRALRVCHHCPVKRRCDTYDVKLGQDKDWHTNYTYP
jgi:hypothetical protein